MKNSRIGNNLVLSIFFVAICVFKAQADTPNIREFTFGAGQGGFSIVESAGDPNFNNPNAFPVVWISPAHGAQWGFLLDGSDLSIAYLSLLQNLKDRSITVMVDANLNNGYAGQYVPGLPSTQCGKIISIQFSSLD
jgi:hypothetical protein